MPTPRTGAIIRPFSTGDLDRIAGKPTVPSDEASRAVIAQAFSPARQFFGAGTPLAPIAPEGTTTGRQWDFPSFLNLTYTPRGETNEGAISYATLRQMASPENGGLDLLRLAIETRKDQMSAQPWSLRGRGDRNNDGGAKAKAVAELLRKPDGINTFRSWMRMIMEDHFVIDAVAIYFSESATTPKRALAEVMAGDTIKKYITSDGGRTPQPPLPAYAQVIKGMPAEDYTLTELGFYIYNPMANRLYGTSRVAQVLTTIVTALNRALYQLEYFTSGTTPDGFMELPKEWDLRRIQQWTEWFNSELEGQASERRKIRFVPEGANYTPTKTEILKDMFDEWLARIICYAFSLPASALVKETNRSTAETSKEAAQEEGLEPTKLWFKDMMDDVLVRIGAEDLEFFWEDEEIVDPQVKVQVVQAQYGGTTGTAKLIITLDEARRMMGHAPATADQLEELQPPTPEALDPDADGGETNPDGTPKDPAKDPAAADGKKEDAKDDKKKEPKADAAEKVATVRIVVEAPYQKKSRAARGGRSLPVAPVSGKQQRATERVVAARVGAVLALQGKRLANVLSGKAEKAAGTDLVTEDTIRALIRAIDDEPWSEKNREALRKALADLAAHAGEAAVKHILEITGGDKEAAAALTQANDNAVKWAEEREGNLITDVSDTTRNTVNQLTANAIEQGLTNDELAARLDSAFLFGEDRAKMIARTETQFASNHGALEGYKALGVEKKAWVGEDPCDDCERNIDDGEIGVDEDFSSGDQAPPAHPNCKCSVIAVVDLETDE